MLLTNDVGLRASDLHRLKSFWTTLKSREDVDALRAELTALRTSSDVTKRLRDKNNGVAIGAGAQRSQSSLNAFLQAVRQPAACALRGEPALVFCVLFFVRVKSSDDISGSETPHALRRVAVRRGVRQARLRCTEPRMYRSLALQSKSKNTGIFSGKGILSRVPSSNRFLFRTTCT